jgi:uncharacterized protein YodC (DUF2158 family)
MDEWYQEEAAAQAEMKFERGDLVNIKLGGQGMVIGHSGLGGHYVIRTGPEGNYERRTFYEFELEAQ